MDRNQYKPDEAHYKVVELSTVTDETIEATLNVWSAKGWLFDQIQFVVRDSSRRPSMAFLFFLKPVLSDERSQFDIERVESEDKTNDCFQNDIKMGDDDETYIS